MTTAILSGTTAPLAAQTAQTKPDTAGQEAMEPLRDTGIKKTKIPEVLQLAASAPYSLVGIKTCVQINREIIALDGALGRDIDQPAEQRGQSAELGAAAARAAVNTLIPGLGLVKVITGADKAQRRAEAAVYAGAVRRGFLKGVGLSRGCKPPAAPLHEAVLDVPELPETDGKGN
ncbi:hypothetical protein ACLB0R_03100 [Sphingomonas sp. GlSt437]